MHFATRSAVLGTRGTVISSTQTPQRGVEGLELVPSVGINKEDEKLRGSESASELVRERSREGYNGASGSAVDLEKGVAV